MQMDKKQVASVWYFVGVFLLLMVLQNYVFAPRVDTLSYSEFKTFALTIDKVDAGRVLQLQRLVPDSNRDLRFSINSSALGPGEYRMRLQGYTWRGALVDVGWVRLVVSPPL